MYDHAYISQQPMTNYDMSKPPGRTYKYYQGTPLWPFGFGLSMTTFGLTCAKDGASYSCGAFSSQELIFPYIVEVQFVFR